MNKADIQAPRSSRMTTTVNNYNQLPAELQPAIRQFAELLQKLGSSNLKGLTLFGAIAAGAFDATRHTVRSVAVVEKVDLHMLRKLAEHGAKLGKAHLSAPLIMTPSYIDESRDTFPLELIEIHQNHITLSGTDYFKDLSFEDNHVRLQCERELKVISIGFVRGCWPRQGREKFLAELETSMAENLMRTLRGMLWLKGRKEAQPALEVIAEVENLTNRKLPGVRAALNPSADHSWEQFEALYRRRSSSGRYRRCLVNLNCIISL